MFGRALCPVAWDDSVLKVLSRHSPESCYFFWGGGSWEVTREYGFNHGLCCLRVQIEASKRKTEFTKWTYENISQFNWKNLTDANLTRQLSTLTDLGIAVLSVDEVLKVSTSPPPLLLSQPVNQ